MKPRNKIHLSLVLFLIAMSFKSAFSQVQSFGDAPLQEFDIFFYDDSAAINILIDEDFIRLESRATAPGKPDLVQEVTLNDDPEEILVTFYPRNEVIIVTKLGTTVLLYTYNHRREMGKIRVNGKIIGVYNFKKKKFIAKKGVII